MKRIWKQVHPSLSASTDNLQFVRSLLCLTGLTFFILLGQAELYEGTKGFNAQEKK